MVAIKEWYGRVNETWPKEIPKLTPEEAIRAGKKLYRFVTGHSFGGEVKLTSGKRYSYIRHGDMFVNAERGWDKLVHELSHSFFYKIYHYQFAGGPKPHSRQHARLEMKMIKEVLKRGWLTGTLKTAEPEPPAELPPEVAKQLVVSTKLSHSQKMLLRAETRAKRANTILKKWQRKVRYYEQRAEKVHSTKENT